MSLSFYGLDVDIFGDEYIDPLRCPEQLDKYVKVEGFGEHKDSIDKLFADSKPLNRFFLIYGQQGTGRTSVANYIAEKTRDYGSPLKVSSIVADEDQIGSIHAWMGELSFAALSGQFKLVGETINNDLKQVIIDKPYQNEFIYRKLLFDVIRSFTKDEIIVAIFEQVRNPKIFTLAAQIFNQVGEHFKNKVMVIFTTSEENLKKDFENLGSLTAMPPIVLRSLQSEEIYNFIVERWKQFKPDVPPPFDEDVKAVLHGIKPSPMKNVIKTIKYFLDKKIESLGKIEGNWPDNESLKIKRGEVAEFLLFKDSAETTAGE
jgi:predicted ATPase